MGKIVNVHAAKTHLSRLLDDALLGEEVVIARDGVPLVRLVPVSPPQARRTPGHWRGKVTIGPDFDAPLPSDIADAFGAR